MMVCAPLNIAMVFNPFLKPDSPPWFARHDHGAVVAGGEAFGILMCQGGELEIGAEGVVQILGDDGQEVADELASAKSIISLALVIRRTRSMTCSSARSRAAVSTMVMISVTVLSLMGQDEFLHAQPPAVGRLREHGAEHLGHGGRSA